MNTKEIVKLTIVDCSVGNRNFTLALYLPYVKGKPVVSPDAIRKFMGYSGNIPVRIHS
jgi:hypothetical protein